MEYDVVAARSSRYMVGIVHLQLITISPGNNPAGNLQNNKTKGKTHEKE
ncbi:MAG TPA: hypothetical protein VGD14_18985 [bacterium]